MEIFILAVLFIGFCIWAMGAKMKADRKRDAEIMRSKMTEKADENSSNSFSSSAGSRIVYTNDDDSSDGRLINGHPLRSDEDWDKWWVIKDFTDSI